MSLSTSAKRVVLSLALIPILFATAPSSAGDKISADHLAAARNAAVAVGATRQMELVLPIMLSQMERTFSQFNPELTADFAAVFETLQDTFSNRMDSFTDQIATDYAKKFTVTELETIAAFHSSAAGKKFFKTERELQKSSARVGRAFSEQLGREIDTAVRAEMKKRGHPL